MLNWISNLTNAFRLYVHIFRSKISGTKRTGVRLKKKLSITQISLKEGEQYRLGEATVTLAKFGIEGKQEVAKKIEAANIRRAERRRVLTDRGIDLAMLPPNELLEKQIAHWLEDRKKFQEKIDSIIGEGIPGSEKQPARTRPKPGNTL